MRVVLTGASGDFGTAILRRLITESRVDSIVAISRSPLRVADPRIETVTLDLATDPVDRVMAGADAVIHCAFVVEEPRDKAAARRVNVDGSARILRAADAAGAAICVMTSSVNAYGPRGGPEALDESAPIGAGPEHYYLHHKALVEEDIRQWRHTSGGRMAVAVLRPTYIVGPDMDNSGLASMRARVVAYPTPWRSYYQFLHQDDLADAYVRVIRDRVDGEFNVGAEDAVTVAQMCRWSRSLCVPLPLGLAGRLADLGYRLRLLPYSSHWVTPGEPVTTSRRLRHATGWRPARTSAEAARLMLAGG